MLISVGCCVSQIDKIDDAIVNQRSWSPNYKKNGLIYAECCDRSTGTKRTIMMHRLIMEHAGFDLTELQINHIDHDGLNNLRENLRIATCSQNNMNQRKQKNKTSKYKGVHWDKETQKWQVQIEFEGDHQHLGRFKDEDDAGRAYNAAAIRLFGQFAYLNDVPEPPRWVPPKNFRFNCK